MKKLNQKQKRKIELGIIISVALISFFLWNTILILPIKIFVVLMHEIFHGLATLLTGGSIVSIEIQSNLGGECITKGGVPFVIASAGYLGSLLTGSLLFVSGYNNKISIWVCTIISAILIIFAANYMVGFEGLATAVIFSAIMFISPRYFNKRLHLYIMKILGLISSLYVLVDIKEDLLTLNYRMTDAQLLADISGVPAIVWGFLWISISIIAVYLLFKQSYKKGMKI